ncbi:sigma-54-dependent Fis family transcriptional regulator [Iodidimonas gelatinilytica]|uniref:Sigma-54-dependent Fis family transcriptional regulator n=1 Tax=Iodidimonas gelatinilytica TaxID=1236966 RepID=A0A5A7MLX4_9PROT|nr:sigma-54 dependent transcriptional regulator [Iodidimonas gelatinilytica]GEQ97012.1 sigma-54-dependent Fis family transcriptional regulator [Iodidimonas gelatinilytica]GER01744.1 sigma-54-dependent Fis family transcriptional regulator [Iodidimonas gelatinilytica]
MTHTPHILIVEDSLSLARTYEAYLRRLEAKTQIAADLAQAKAALSQGVPDLILLDVKLPDGDGLSLLSSLPEGATRPPVIVMTAHGSVSKAVEAMQAGATDFLVKPFDADRLVTTTSNALENRRLSSLVKRYEDSFRGEGFGEFIGKSLPMQAVYRMIESAGPSKASVFITGESGTGKELCAAALHTCSPRTQGAFVALNCAALPKDLIESEIFGHKKGAFTGATGDREGAAVKAHLGTLFLDEVCEMDLALQSKLLRFLQTGMVQPVGSDDLRKVDVRIVCATNRDPMAEVRSGRFREDLYYRLHVIPIELPPLRDRGNDAVDLARAFLTQLSKEEGKSFERLSEDAENAVRRYGWPGNVREMRNVIQTAVVLNDGPVLEEHMLSRSLHTSDSGDADHSSKETQKAAVRDVPARIEPLALVERRAIERAIDLCGGNVSQAAAYLEVAPSTLYRKLQSWDDRVVDDAAAMVSERHS